jgi:hypothetical protein
MSDYLPPSHLSDIDISKKIRPIWLAPSASSGLFLACIHGTLQERIRHEMLDFETKAFAEEAAKIAFESALTLSKSFSSSLASHRIYQYWRSMKDASSGEENYPEPG